MSASSAARGTVVQYRHRFGTAEFDESRRELRVAGVVVEVDPKPLQVLALLLTHVGEVVTRTELLDEVWGRRPAVETVLGNTVLRLRQALGPDNAARVVTLPRIGFRLEGPVERIAVGRKLFSELQLSPGMEVPERPQWRLERQLGPAHGREVWLARHARTGEPRVYKFSTDGEHLGSLKRETTLYRLLLQSAADPDAFVRIIDWNFATPPFFLEAEYGGDNLADWAIADQRLAAASIAQRLALFLQIADAVAVAHGLGILHKDLKPGNLLVAADKAEGGWRVRLTDFGNARLLEPGRLAELGITAHGLTLEPGETSSGTPLYLAPELLAGATPTMQSDVYALGLILCQVLAADLQRRIAPGWDHDIGDELLREDIAHATAHDPTQRPASAAELALRLRRLEARREALQQQRRAEADARELAAALARTRARRPLLIATMITLALGLVTSLAFYLRSDRALREATRQQSRAEAINQFFNDDLLGAANPLRPARTPDPPISEVLSLAESRLQGRFADDPYAEASVRLSLGVAFNGTGNYVAAEQQRRRAVELLTATAGEADPLSLHARYQWALSLCATGRFPDALAQLDRADSRGTAVKTTDFRLAMLAALVRGNCLHAQVQPEAAITQFEHALAVLDEHAPDDRLQRLLIGMPLADDLVRVGRYADGERLGRQLLSLSSQDMSLTNRSTVKIVLGQSLLVQGRIAEAAPLFREAYADALEAPGPDNRRTLTALSYLANAYTATGEWPQALETATAAWEGFRKKMGDNDLTAQMLRMNVGIVEFYSGLNERAGHSLAEAHAQLATKLGADSAAAQTAAFYLATVQVSRGRAAQAKVLAASLDAKVLESGGPGEGWVGRLKGLRGQILLADKRPEAETLLDEAVRELESTTGVSPWFVEPYRAALSEARSAP
ncbi:MAG: protein kinase domain-containing protein [Panacagrimonas sp.]